jgi:hypothetical protein
MPGKANPPFDPKEFLANVGEGKTILKFGSKREADTLASEFE